MPELNEQLVYIGQGVALTLKLMASGLLIGLALGILLAILNYNQIAIFVIRRFISLIRGTPLILQLSLIYFVLPSLLGLKANILMAGILAFGINSSAYIAETIRAGIESLPIGQFEAAATLEISKFHLWKDIILPQVLKNILPALTSEIITLLKDTALISTIGGMDIMRKSQSIAAEQFSYFLPLCIAGCYYYGLVLLIERGGKVLEKRINYASY